MKFVQVCPPPADGPVKKPKLERKPKLIMATTQPATMITEGR